MRRSCWNHGYNMQPVFYIQSAITHKQARIQANEVDVTQEFKKIH